LVLEKLAIFFNNLRRHGNRDTGVALNGPDDVKADKMGVLILRHASGSARLTSLRKTEIVL
jgi:hypothetical protein